MRGLTVSIAVALAATALPVATASHVDTRAFEKGCGFTEGEWEEGVYDCGGSIPSIQDPGFVPAEETTAWLDDGDRVIGVEGDQGAKAYPLKILNWHEIVNDEHPDDGTPIVVTYCPLCGSSAVFDRTVEGQVLDFHVSGYLFKQDLVMVDEQTHSLWPQILGTAARGDLHGTDLNLVASSTVTWDEWSSQYPDTLVLERPRCDDGSTDNRRSCSGAFQRDYDRSPYGNYDETRSVGISGDSREDILGMHPKAEVHGIVLDGTPVAFPLSQVSSQGVVHQPVEGTPLVVAWFGGDAHVFEDPDERRFTLDPGNATLLDEAGNAYELPSGVSEGASDLEPVEGVTLFWFAWLDHHPDTFALTEKGLERVDGYEPREEVPGPGLAGAIAGLVAAAGLAGALRGRRRGS